MMPLWNGIQAQAASYLIALADEADRARFYKEVFDEVKTAFSVQENGEIIFRFPRLFFTAVK